MSGYQADIGEGYWGALYDESRRNMVLVYPRSEAVRGAPPDRLEPLRHPRDGRPDHAHAQRPGLGAGIQGDRPGHRPSRAAGRADSRRRADGSPVQGHDDPAPAHAHGRRAEPAGVPPPHGQDRPGRAEIHGLRARGLRRHRRRSR